MSKLTISATQKHLKGQAMTMLMILGKDAQQEA